MSKLNILPLFLFLISCSSEEFGENAKFMESGSTYLDYASSWSINSESISEFVKISKLEGNSSGINNHAKRLNGLEWRSTKIIADKIGAFSSQIHFTSGATLSNNIAILGVAYKHPKCHLITSKIEHKSVLNVFKHLESIGYKVTYIDVDDRGKINLKQLSNSIQNDTKLMSIQMFNSEIGVLQNIEEIGRIAKKRKVLFHTDAAQSFCKYSIDVNKMNIDLLTISGHKIGAPKGVGALYVRELSELKPIIFGSENKIFSGTRSTALICAFAKASQVFKINKKQIARNFNSLISELKKIDGIHINSYNPSYIVSVSIDGVLLNDVLELMRDYSFSAGCSCLGQGKSNVISAIDRYGKLPSCTIRISFSDVIKESQLINFAKGLKIVVERLRKEKKIGKNCESTFNKQGDLNNSLDKIQELINNGK